MHTIKPTSGNPLLPGIGLCDPHVRIFDDKAYLYATHDRGPDNTTFAMDDWWIWSSDDLVKWQHESTILPEQTYYGRRDASCWAVDAMDRNGKYYFYFSRGPENVGVMVADSPIGPWHDPLGKPFLAKGLVPTEIRDPALFTDDDGSGYIAFGTFDFFIARLGVDMISLAESPRRIVVHEPTGPYGDGMTDDKPYLHKRNGVYYLSWGCYYATSASVYGPYQCHGSIIRADRVSPTMSYNDDRPVDFDRHGSFFEWRGQWFFICNETGLSRNPYYRDSTISYVTYNENGDIEPIYITEAGVKAVK